METLSKIGGDGAIQFIAESGQHLSEATVVGSHGEATLTCPPKIGPGRMLDLD